MKKITQELEKLSHYYDSEMIIDKYTMAPVYEFIHKKTGKKYVYRHSMTDLKDFGPSVVKMFNELKMEIREDKLNDLGL
jgi:transposase